MNIYIVVESRGVIQGIDNLFLDKERAQAEAYRMNEAQADLEIETNAKYPGSRYRVIEREVIE